MSSCRNACFIEMARRRLHPDVYSTVENMESIFMIFNLFQIFSFFKRTPTGPANRARIVEQRQSKGVLRFVGFQETPIEKILSEDCPEKVPIGRLLLL